MSITKSIKAGNIPEVYQYFLDETNHLKLHDKLIKHCSTLTQYYYMKAIRFVAEEHEDIWTFYMNFAEASIQSKYGQKFIFHNILNNLYSKGSDTYALVYCHNIEDALPQVQEFYKVLKEVYELKKEAEQNI